MYNIGGQNTVKPMIQEITPAKTVQNMGLTGGFLLAGTGLQPVFSAGKGCLLIRADVFENTNIRFRTEPDLLVHDDTFLAADLNKNNIPVWLDTHIICTHKNSDWKTINKNFTNKHH
jgi:GT2 family glycosyltransferase